jgi:hypothetical protein
VLPAADRCRVYGSHMSRAVGSHQDVAKELLIGGEGPATMLRGGLNEFALPG